MPSGDASLIARKRASLKGGTGACLATGLGQHQHECVGRERAQLFAGIERVEGGRIQVEQHDGNATSGQPFARIGKRAYALDQIGASGHRVRLSTLQRTAQPLRILRIGVDDQYPGSSGIHVMSVHRALPDQAGQRLQGRRLRRTLPSQIQLIEPQR
jgi:hypothetical protein